MQHTFVKKCRICGSTYTMIRNEQKSKYDLKFYNTDDQYGYSSNKCHNVCPTCVVTKRSE